MIDAVFVREHVGGRFPEQSEHVRYTLVGAIRGISRWQRFLQAAVISVLIIMGGLFPTML